VASTNWPASGETRSALNARVKFDEHGRGDGELLERIVELRGQLPAEEV
jgi:hypothetical protein